MSTLAPDFTLPSTSGSDVTLSDPRGAPVVLFFYPRDNTPGCTTESLDFTALNAEFVALGCQVFGISADDLASHEKFISKKALGIPLLADTETTTCVAYDVWKEKKMYGKTFMGIERSTFVIDATGAIAKEWRKVKVAGHAAEVLEVVKAL